MSLVLLSGLWKPSLAPCRVGWSFYWLTSAEDLPLQPRGIWGILALSHCSVCVRERGTSCGFTDVKARKDLCENLTQHPKNKALNPPLAACFTVTGRLSFPSHPAGNSRMSLLYPSPWIKPHSLCTLLKNTCWNHPGFTPGLPPSAMGKMELHPCSPCCQFWVLSSLITGYLGFF